MHHAPSEKFFSGLGKRSVSHTLSQLSSSRINFRVAITGQSQIFAGTNADYGLTDAVNGF
jgi:hypothetical protein